MPEDGEEEAEHCDMPAGCISKSVSTKTTQIGKKKTTVTTTVYKFKDGSSKTQTNTVTQTS